MTTGIYLLEFADGIEYVGQAVDIERRWDQHRANMWANKAANKMQQAFKKHGMPSFSVLIPCHRDHLNLLESYYIQQREPLLNTVVETVLTDWQLEMVSLNIGLFHLSVLEMIEILACTETKMEEEQESVKRWVEMYRELEERQEADVCSDVKEKYEELLSILEERNKSLEKEVENLTNRIKVLSRPWWKRLFD